MAVVTHVRSPDTLLVIARADIPNRGGFSCPTNELKLIYT